MSLPDFSATVGTTPPTVLVTGAAKRLGRHIALLLAQQGYQVAVHYRASAHEAEQTVLGCLAQGQQAAAFAADLNNDEQLRTLLPRVIEHFGAVDAVINSASAFEHDHVANFCFQTLERHLRTNTAAPIVLAQALHSHVQARGGSNARAAVINLLDQKLWNPNPDFLSYTLSKAALEAATTILALALSPLVRVVGVAPGLTLTSEYLSPERFDELHKLSPLGRSSTPEDVSQTVLFALRNTSLTGTTVVVDGGQHLIRFERDFSMMQR